MISKDFVDNAHLKTNPKKNSSQCHRNDSKNFRYINLFISELEKIKRKLNLLYVDKTLNIKKNLLIEIIIL